MAAFESCLELGPGLVLDIDLDIFDPIMDYIPEELKLTCLRSWIGKARFITMATSPFFMDQIKAVRLANLLLA